MKQISIGFTDEQLAALRATADADGERSIASVIRKIVNETIEVTR